MPNKINSNDTGLSIAEELSLKVLPGVAGADAVWYEQEPNGYPSFGGELSMMVRSPINASRQDQKGTATGNTANGGFTADFTKSNMKRLLQGFFFADARELASTAPLAGAAVVMSSALAADKSYNAPAGLNVFAANELVFVSGYNNALNNGVKNVVSAVAAKVVVSETTVDEAVAPSGAKLEKVGYKLAVADAGFVVASGIPSLTVTAGDFTTMAGMFPGNWIFIGGDVASTRFANNVGFARIATVAAKALTFDDTTFTPVTEAGTGKTIHLYLGAVVRNEKNPALIKRRSYQLERRLGMGPTAVQAEYVVGAVANQFTLNIPKVDKLTCDLSYVGCDTEYRTGEVGDTVKVGVHVVAPGESAYNTSSDIYRIKMAILNPGTSNPTPLFGYVDGASIAIDNGVTPDTAVGVFGAFDVSTGNFKVSGSITAFFSTVAAVQAVRKNSDVGISVISASKNSGFVFDIPLVGLGGGMVNVEKDKAIQIPLTAAGAENKNGYTMLSVHYSYLPTLAMPTF